MNMYMKKHTDTDMYTDMPAGKAMAICTRRHMAPVPDEAMHMSTGALKRSCISSAMPR